MMISKSVRKMISKMKKVGFFRVIKSVKRRFRVIF